MLEAAEMLAELSGLKDVTVFAPSNKAVDSLPKNVLADIMVRIIVIFLLPFLVL